MKTTIKSITLLFLIFTLLITGACRNVSPGTDDLTDTESDTQTEAPEDKLPEPDLPELDLGGADFTIICSNWSIPIWSQKDIGADVLNGEIINDAVFTRNSLVQEKFKCKIVPMQIPYGEVLTTIQRNELSGDAEIDAATIRIRSLKSLITGNYLVDFNEMSYIDLTKPWWDPNSVDSMSIDSKLFAVASDITLMDKDSTAAMVFNKKLQDDYNIESLYQTVDEGKWTLDKLYSLSKLVSDDVDGNGTRDNKDKYGLLYQRDTTTAFLTGSGEYVAGKDADDLLVLTLNTTRAADVFNKIFDVLYDKENSFHVMIAFSDFTTGMNEMFGDNRALFMWIRIADIENLRNMDANFGILPTPKYDEQQEKYNNVVNCSVGVLTAVPKAAASVENSSIVLEYMAYVSKQVLQPKYYDTQLTVRNVRDEESGRMLDTIFSNRAYDIGDVYNFGTLASDIIYMSMAYNRNIASLYAGKETAANNEIKSFVDAIQKLK